MVNGFMHAYSHESQTFDCHILFLVADVDTITGQSLIYLNTLKQLLWVLFLYRKTDYKPIICIYSLFFSISRRKVACCCCSPFSLVHLSLVLVPRDN